MLKCIVLVGSAKQNIYFSFMKVRSFILGIPLLLLSACEEPVASTVGSPEHAIDIIVYAANSQDFDTLNCLCDSIAMNDRNVTDLCAVPGGSDHLKKMFIIGFRDMQIDTSSTSISNDGTTAVVPVSFASDSTRNNCSVTLTHAYNNWYLSSMSLDQEIVVNNE